MATMVSIQLQNGLGFIAAAFAFGVLAWCMTALRSRRGYIVPALGWMTNLLGYNFVLVAVAAPAPLMSMWGQVLACQGLVTVIFIGLWLAGERLYSWRRQGYSG